MKAKKHKLKFEFRTLVIINPFCSKLKNTVALVDERNAQKTADVVVAAEAVTNDATRHSKDLIRIAVLTFPSIQTANGSVTVRVAISNCRRCEKRLCTTG